MGYVPRVPRSVRSFDGALRSARADLARIERKRHAPVPPPSRAHLEPEASTGWKPGEAWLKTEESGT